MEIVLFISVLIVSFLLFYTLLKPEGISFNVLLLVASVGVGFVVKRIGTYTGCADGWTSTNIGTQGACSHHGGVITYLNVYGFTAMAICTGLIVLLLLIRYKRFKNDSY